MRVAFLKNKFHISENTQSNRNVQRRQGIVIGCVEVAKSILEAAKSFRLNQKCIFCFTGLPRKKFPYLKSRYDREYFIDLNDSSSG